MKRQRGFSFFAMIMVVVVIIAALSAAMMATSRTNETAMSDLRNSQLVVSQANLIRSKLINCAIDIPGNNGGSFHLPYPRADVETNVSGLTCPGTGLSLWTGSDAIFAPTAPFASQTWKYINDATSVRISLSDSSPNNALTLAATKFGAAEVAGSSSSTFILTITN